jgi:hypothetical protein
MHWTSPGHTKPLTTLQVKSKALKNKNISIKIIVISYYIKIQINSFKINKLNFISIINYFIGRERIFIVIEAFALF